MIGGTAVTVAAGWDREFDGHPGTVVTDQVLDGVVVFHECRGRVPVRIDGQPEAAGPFIRWYLPTELRPR